MVVSERGVRSLRKEVVWAIGRGAANWIEKER